MSKLITIILLTASAASAQDLYLSQGAEVTKIEAVKLLLRDRGVKVMRCYEVELTDKVTLRKRKVVK